MKSPRFQFVLQLIALHLCLHLAYAVAEKTGQEKRNYIVQMDKSNKPAAYEDHFQWYESSLKSVSDSAEMLYTYNEVIHGFSARLTVGEAASLQGRLGIVSMLPDARYELHTTRTPGFLGLDLFDAFPPEPDQMSEVVVGVVDTGVWPEIGSFDDQKLSPVPRTWKGECEAGTNFNSSSCNKKLIGARFFLKGYEASAGKINDTKESRSARDDDGHGTHTSSTAAGSAVVGASLFNYASGTARGMARHARLSMYKVFWNGGCYGTDVLAAMDKAVEDGVHVLSISLGDVPSQYYKDVIAIGAFGAMAQGIFVSCSAGNNGPDPFTLTNLSPWTTTVGARTLDRDFPAAIRLGNGMTVSGTSLYSGKPLPSPLLPLIFAGNASGKSGGNLCLPETLIPEKVAGKIVLCEQGTTSGTEIGSTLKNAGAAGMILSNPSTYEDELIAEAYLFPTAFISSKSGESIKRYISSTPNPSATLVFKGTKLCVQPSPVVASFSSRGPNSITGEILKPDLIAPGVNILAGWTGKVAPSRLEIDTRRVPFNIMSGTSTSCPHVAGLAALLKAVNPDWSPAAIKSALMTTSYRAYKNGKAILDNKAKKPASPFDFGAGHVNPVASLDPGLVYDITVDEYLDFLCASGYSKSQIKSITNMHFNCDPHKEYSIRNLNYPSFAVLLHPPPSAKNHSNAERSMVKYTRILTNVGPSGTYRMSVRPNMRPVKILVEPKELHFSKLYEKKNYTITFIASKPARKNMFTYLEWSHGMYRVISPIAIRSIDMPVNGKKI